MDAWVEGFVVDRDPVVQQSFLPLSDGLTVLYGLNGAGKTRILRAIRSALTGDAAGGRLSVVVRVGRPTPAEIEQSDQIPMRFSLLRALARRLAGDRRADEYTDGYDSPPQFSLELADETFEQSIRWHLPHRRLGDAWPDDTIDALTAAALRQRLVLLTPAGSTHHPAWQAWHLLQGTPDEPASTEILETFVDSVEASGDGWDLEADAPFHPLDGLGRTYAVLKGDNTTTDLVWQLIDGPIDLGIDLYDQDGDPDVGTALALGEAQAEVQQRNRQRAVEGILDQLDGRAAAATPEESAEPVVQDIAATLQAQVHSRLADALLDPPPIELRLASWEERFVHPSAAWRTTHLGWRSHGIADLSNAERTWTSWAVGDTLYWWRRDRTASTHPLRPLLTLLDEPESGLHRTAEAHMARMLERLAADPRRRFVVASHSPELMNLAGAHIVHVRRGPERSTLSALPPATRDDLGDLGLLPSDLLRRQRAFLLVEGEHDEAVLNAFVGDELRDLRVQILAMRGVSRLPASIESRTLFTYTDALVVALVDNADAVALRDAWDEARLIRLTSGLDEASRFLRAAGNGPSDESKHVVEWLDAALARGYETRVAPYALSAKDVTDYLPVEHFVPGAQSWADLRRRHADARAAGKGADRNFKVWLWRTEGADFSPASLTAAARDAPVPPEFRQLVAYLGALTTAAPEM